MSDNEEISILMHPTDMGIIYGRSVFCFISMFFSILLMIAYLILILQVKFRFCQIKDINTKKDDELTVSNNSDLSSNESTKNKDKTSIGLGSHFMFILTLSNFLGALFESLFYFHYKNINTDCVDESATDEDCIQTFIKINDSLNCKLIGLSHNFFDLYSVCWTSMLTLLFYRSTSLKNQMIKSTKKYLIIGFIYSTGLSLILSLIPYLTGDNYGFSRFYCSYRYRTDIDENGAGYERGETKGWRFTLVAVLMLNLVFNLFCLIKTHKFYSEKLKTLKSQDKKEYKSFIIFVWIFRIFPIVIFISRFYKSAANTLIGFVDKKNKEYDKTSVYIIEYINSIIFASNGIFISLACLIFFRGIFICCSSRPIKERTSIEQKTDMRFLEEDTPY